MQILGTSSLHDWEMNVTDFDVAGSFSATEITDLLVTIKSKSMESGKSIMDNKAYDATQADEYPTMTFSASTLKVGTSIISGTGKLEIAGKSRSLDLSAKIISHTANEIQLNGEVPLKMSDFDMTPPTAMFGTLKTGDEVTISYSIVLIK